ncbi:hypothetical protein N7488_008062 [Penicillium malachiteum]|nr:hypothetical protein N7488_008062 [Penicillium malachiteum]
MTVSKVNSPASSPGKDNSGASSEHGWQGRFGHLPIDDLFLFQNPENRERPLPPPNISWRQRVSQDLQSKVSSLCTFFRLPPMPGFDLSAFTHGVHMLLQMVFASLVLLVAGRLIWEEALFHQASSFKEAVRPLLVFLGILRGSTTIRAMWRAFWDLLLG